MEMHVNVLQVSNWEMEDMEVITWPSQMLSHLNHFHTYYLAK
jgi:hypothetical protein